MVQVHGGAKASAGAGRYISTQRKKNYLGGEKEKK
jgi:hypothetical protein